MTVYVVDEFFRSSNCKWYHRPSKVFATKQEAKEYTKTTHGRYANIYKLELNIVTTDKLLKYLLAGSMSQCQQCGFHVETDNRRYSDK